jgi:NADPH:quinone reductase
MKAVQFGRFGGPEVLEIVDLPTPRPARSQVLLRVHAAGINYFEVLMRSNRYAVTPALPMRPGVEVAGIVEAVGEDVAPDMRGVRVAVPLFAFGGSSGGYAEYVTVDASSLVPVPEILPFADAVALQVQGLTALHLSRLRDVTDKTVVVSAAAGGVGSLLIQFLKAAQARTIIALTSSQPKQELALSLGADRALSHVQETWPAALHDTSGPADLIFDLVGGALTRSCLSALAPGGEIVFAALGRFELAADEVDGMFANNQTLSGFALLPRLTRNTVKAELLELFDRAASRRLKVIPGGSFPLERAADAHRAIESRETVGKVVLFPHGDNQRLSRDGAADGAFTSSV